MAYFNLSVAVLFIFATLSNTLGKIPNANGENNGECHDCNEETMACCGDGYGCATPCQSQFEAVPCDHLPANVLKDTKNKCPTLQQDTDGKLKGTLYRATRPSENCQGGLLAKDITAKKTISSHVGCGSRQNYKSQFISFSTSYDVVHDKYWPRVSKGAHLVKVDIKTQAKGCKIYDLTNPEVREEYLGRNPWAKNYAISDCEVLLECGTSRVRCNTMMVKSEVAGGGKTEL